MNKPLFPALLVSLLLGASACAARPPLHTDASVTAIHTAEALGAAEVPQAAFHLDLAKQALVTATELHADGRVTAARSYIQRAQADAELALALSRADAERTAALEAVAKLHALQLKTPPVNGGAP